MLPCDGIIIALSYWKDDWIMAAQLPEQAVPKGFFLATWNFGPLFHLLIGRQDSS